LLRALAVKACISWKNFHRRRTNVFPNENHVHFPLTPFRLTVQYPFLYALRQRELRNASGFRYSFRMHFILRRSYYVTNDETCYPCSIHYCSVHFSLSTSENVMCRGLLVPFPPVFIPHHILI